VGATGELNRGIIFSPTQIQVSSGCTVQSGKRIFREKFAEPKDDALMPT